MFSSSSPSGSNNSTKSDVEWVFKHDKLAMICLTSPWLPESYLSNGMEFLSREAKDKPSMRVLVVFPCEGSHEREPKALQNLRRLQNIRRMINSSIEAVCKEIGEDSSKLALPTMLLVKNSKVIARIAGLTKGDISKAVDMMASDHPKNPGATSPGMKQPVSKPANVVGGSLTSDSGQKSLEIPAEVSLCPQATSNLFGVVLKNTQEAEQEMTTIHTALMNQKWESACKTEDIESLDHLRKRTSAFFKRGKKSFPDGARIHNKVEENLAKAESMLEDCKKQAFLHEENASSNNLAGGKVGADAEWLANELEPLKKLIENDGTSNNNLRSSPLARQVMLRSSQSPSPTLRAINMKSMITAMDELELAKPVPRSLVLQPFVEEADKDSVMRLTTSATLRRDSEDKTR